MIIETGNSEYYGFRHREFKSDLPIDEQKKQINILTHNAIFFHLSGELQISWDNHKDISIIAGDLYFLPRGANVSACILSERIEYIVFRFDHDLDNSPAFMDLHKAIQENCNVQQHPFPKLKANGPMVDFIESVKQYTQDKIKNIQLYNVKHTELYIILLNYYTKQECIDLFHPILKKNSNFRNTILDNYSLSISIDELAAKCNMSRSTFDRTFKKAFGMTPYKWIETQTRILIMRKASEPNVTVKDIMYEVGISNSSQFTNLCKRLFGKNPTQIILHK